MKKFITVIIIMIVIMIVAYVIWIEKAKEYSFNDFNEYAIQNDSTKMNEIFLNDEFWNNIYKLNEYNIVDAIPVRDYNMLKGLLYVIQENDMIKITEEFEIGENGLTPNIMVKGANVDRMLTELFGATFSEVSKKNKNEDLKEKMFYDTANDIYYFKIGEENCEYVPLVQFANIIKIEKSFSVNVKEYRISNELEDPEMVNQKLSSYIINKDDSNINNILHEYENIDVIEKNISFEQNENAKYFNYKIKSVSIKLDND